MLLTQQKTGLRTSFKLMMKMGKKAQVSAMLYQTLRVFHTYGLSMMRTGTLPSQCASRTLPLFTPQHLLY